MPNNSQDVAKERARQTLLRADAEMEALKEANETVRRLEAQRLQTLLLVETTIKARGNLLMLAEKAARMEGAYSDHSAALVESSINSRNLAQLDKSLTISYLLVALGKVADIYFVVNGKGKTLLAARAKLIPNAKTAIVDLANTGTKLFNKGLDTPKGDTAKFAAQGIHLGFIGDAALQQGDVITELAEDVAKTQTYIVTVIEIVKDVATLINGRNEGNLRTQVSLYCARITEILAKLTDIAQRLTRLIEGFPSKVGTVRAPTQAQGWGKDFADLQKNWNAMKPSEYLAVLKYAIEALQNFLLALSSGLNGLENRDLANEAAAQAEREQSAQGGGYVAFDLEKFAALGNKDLLDYIRNIDSAPDAHQMAGDSVIRAGKLRTELGRMNEYLRVYPALKATADSTIDPALSRLRETDRDLAAILKEFETMSGSENEAMRAEAMRGQASDKTRERDSVNLAAWIGAIKMSREKIRTLTGDR